MKIRNLLFNLLAFSAIILFNEACTPTPNKNHTSDKMVMHDKVVTQDEHSEINKAVCVLHPTKGNSVSGVVTFTKSGSGIKVNAEISGLTPGKHGFHVHQYGDCTSPDGKSAGGHFNPEEKDHGGPHGSERHVGDLGNIEADQEGNVNYQMVDSLISFSGANSVIGRAIIVHAGEDDLTSQPTGDAGARVASGVIGIAKD